MPRTCTICAHPQVTEINAALIANKLSNRRIAAQFSIAETSLRRHRENHLPEHLVQAQEAHEITRADDLLSQVRDLQARALSILEKAEKAGELRTALGAIREARSSIELLANLLGKLQQQTPVVNIVLTPEWIQLRTVILQALEPYLDARLAVVEALNAGTL